LKRVKDGRGGCLKEDMKERVKRLGPEEEERKKKRESD
jgi:hypothetical protein